jgi:1,4-dihydroxy-2-naphthoate octaprenyltransferase
VLAIGSASLAAALAYMGGPKPIAYTPFGELTVFVFFGLVAVTGTDWVLTGSVGTASTLAAVAIGCLAAAALAVNNHRDIAHDRAVGRRTWAVRVGERGSLALFSGLLAAAFLLLPLMAWQARSAALLLPGLMLPVAWRLRHALVHGPRGLAYNAVLFGSFRLEWRFALLLSAGALLDGAARLAR